MVPPTQSSWSSVWLQSNFSPGQGSSGLLFGYLPEGGLPVLRIWLGAGHSGSLGQEVGIPALLGPIPHQARQCSTLQGVTQRCEGKIGHCGFYQKNKDFPRGRCTQLGTEAEVSQ